MLALRRIDPADAPPAYRSEPLASSDPAAREALAALGGVLDRASATAVWNEALTAEPFTDRPVWVHGDLQPGNVLVADGRLTAVIDFGCTGLADPAVDLIAAWYRSPFGVVRAAQPGRRPGTEGGTGPCQHRPRRRTGRDESRRAVRRAPLAPR